MPKRSLLLTAVVCAATSPLLYEATRTLLDRLGYPVFVFFTGQPETVTEAWPVAAGAALSGLWVAYSLATTSENKLLSHGIARGALAGLLNIPFSVLLALTVFHLRWGWRYGYGCLLDEWYRSVLQQIAFAAPVALPLGVLYGVAIALVEQRRRWTKETLLLHKRKQFVKNK